MNIYSPEKYDPDFDVEFGDSKIERYDGFGDLEPETDFYAKEWTTPEQNKIWINDHNWSLIK